MHKNESVKLTRFSRKKRHRLEHRNSPECLGTVLQGMFHILKHGLLPDRLFDLPLGFDIERVGFESGYLPLTFDFGVRLHLTELTEQLGESSRVRACGICQLRLCLSMRKL